MAENTGSTPRSRPNEREASRQGGPNPDKATAQAPVRKRKAPAKKRPAVKPVLPPPAPEPVAPVEASLVNQMRTMAGKVLDMGAATVGAAKSLHTATEVAKALRQGKPMEAAADVSAPATSAAPAGSRWMPRSA
jgi:hypothetical protein